MTRADFLEKATKCVTTVSVEEWVNLYKKETGNEGRELEDKAYEDACKYFKYFKKKVTQKYNQHQRDKNKMKQDPWMGEIMDISLSYQDFHNKKGGPGAKKKDFDELSWDSQRKILKESDKGHSLNRLLAGAEYRARIQKKNELCGIIKELRIDNTKAVTYKLLKDKENCKPECKNYTPAEALSLILENSLSVNTYRNLR